MRWERSPATWMARWPAPRIVCAPGTASRGWWPRRSSRAAWSAPTTSAADLLDGLGLGPGSPPAAVPARPRAGRPRRADPRRRPRRGRGVRQQGRDRGRGGGGRASRRWSWGGRSSGSRTGWRTSSGAYQGRGVEASVELGSTRAGGCSPCAPSILADLGAYLLPTTAIPPHTTAMLMTGCYDIPAAAVSVRGARTDKVPTGPYRGAGRPEAAYLLELTVDRAARELGLDPVELRRRNLIRSFPHRSALGLDVRLGRLRALPRARARAGAAGARRRSSGPAVAMYVERAGGNWESARVTVEPDGRVIARSGSSPHGQGHETTFAQIVAERLGVGSATSSCASATSAGWDLCEPLGGDGRLGACAGGRPDRGEARRVAAGLLGCPADELTQTGARWRAPDGRRSCWPRSLRPRVGSRPRPASSQISCSVRAHTPRWSRSSARPGRSPSAASPRSTTPGRSSTRCSPRARCSAARCRDSGPC